MLYKKYRLNHKSLDGEDMRRYEQILEKMDVSEFTCSGHLLRVIHGGGPQLTSATGQLPGLLYPRTAWGRDHDLRLEPTARRC